MTATAPDPVVKVEDAPILSVFATKTDGRPARGERARRVVFGFLVAAIALAVATQLSNQSRGARGPSSSTYATSKRGLAAVATLLERNNIQVLRLTRPIEEAWADATVDPNDTLVVLDQDVSTADISAIESHLSSGGQLVAGGRNAAAWMSEVLSSSTANRGVPDASDSAEATFTVPGMRTTLQVRSGAKGTLRYIGALRSRTLTTIEDPDVFVVTPETARVAVAGTDSEDNAAVVRTRRMVLLADPSVLANATLATTDNAAFALELLTPQPGGRIVFAEAGLGFRSGSGAGLAAIPGPVRTLLLGLALAALFWMLAVGQRIGDPDRPDRPLAPGRYEHVAAVAGLLERIGRHSRQDVAAQPAEPAEPAEPVTLPAKDR